jgi:hypothetical protein
LTTTFRLPPEAFEQERARVLRGFYAAYLMALIGATTFGFRALDFSPGAPLFISIGAVTLCLMLSMSIAFWGIFRGLRLRKRRWNSFELEVTDSELIRREADVPDLIIRRDEITGCDETVDRGLFIKTGHPDRFVFVPASLDGYNELKAELSKTLAIPAPRLRDPMYRSPFFIAAVCLVAWSVVWTSDQREPVVLGGFVLTVFLVTSFFVVNRSRRFSPAARRLAWLYLVAVALALAKVVAVWQIASVD